MAEKYEDLLKKMIGESNMEVVTLTDEISVGCDNCGNCCMHTQSRLNGFDVYNILKHYSTEEMMSNMVLYFGDDSNLPLVMIKDNLPTCPYLKADNNGDFVCQLGDDKPMVCQAPFIAVVTKVDDQSLCFVPFDQKIEKIDVEKYLESHRLSNNDLIHTVGRNNEMCHCDKKKTLVSDYLSKRLQYEDECNLANLISMISMRYFNTRELLGILKLANNSRVNILDFLTGKKYSKEEDAYDRISRMLFMHSYFYADPDKTDNFKECALEELEVLQTKVLPGLRILYKYFFKIFDPSETTLKNILNQSEEDAQKAFDEYYERNIAIVSKRFTEVIPEMLKELKEMEEIS